MLSSKTFAVVFMVFVFTSCRTVSPRAVSEIRNDPTGEKTKIMQAVSDLTDLYVFPSATKPGHIALVLNTSAFSSEQPFFSDGVNYIFYLREIMTEKQGQDMKLKPRDFSEKVIMCWFQTPQDQTKHRGSCSLPRLGEVTAKFGEVFTSEKVSFYHGITRDPYVANLDLARKALGKRKGILSLQKGTAETNVLSIVLEFSLDEIFGRTVKLAGLAAQSYTTSNNGQQKPLDRVGRPGIGMFFRADVAKDDAVFKTFKTDRPFVLSEANRMAYNERLLERITKLDEIDKKADWEEVSKSVLTELLVGDYILFDASKTAKNPRFFAIEDEFLNKKEMMSFGGRSLSEDSFGGFLSLLISRNLPVTSALPTAKKTILKFPYLEEPSAKWRGGDGTETSRPRISL